MMLALLSLLDTMLPVQMQVASFQVPRYRLRHLHALQARCLENSTPQPAYTYFAVWSHTCTANGQHEAHCLYVSEQVGGANCFLERHGQLH